MPPTPKSFRLIYAPLPEETNDVEASTAFQYTQRAQTHLQEQGFQATASMIQEDSFSSMDTSVIIIFIVACAADGSIHRSVRKATKKLNTTNNNDEDGTSNLSQSLALCLLGQSRCDNSAKQMNQTIFGAGRRVEKSFAASHHALHQERLETQVELVGPEQDFDPWLESLMTSCRGA